MTGGGEDRAVGQVNRDRINQLPITLNQRNAPRFDRIGSGQPNADDIPSRAQSRYINIAHLLTIIYKYKVHFTVRLVHISHQLLTASNIAGNR